MKNVPSLPPNYTLQSSYDLKSPQLNWIIQLIFLVIAGIMVGAAFLFAWIPASSLHGLVVAAITIGLVLVYMSLHELTHGVVLSLLSKTPFRYAFRFPFLTTGSTSYYNKKSFILVCLVPSVLWGIVLGVLFTVVPSDYRLSLYIVLGLNVAGSAGDYLQVFLAFKTRPKGLIQDDGSITRIYQAS